MRKELKIIGSRDRHVFTATFIRFGFRDGYKGPVKTILLQDVLLDGKIVTDHLWFNLTKGFESADLLPGDVVEFCARVSIYEKGYKGYRNDLVRIRIIRPKKFLGFFRQLTGITIEGAFNRCSACVEIMANDDNGVSMMHYIDYEDIIGVELIKN
mgnify:CR=1 FL=1|jgi:hypothetical protein